MCCHQRLAFSSATPLCCFLETSLPTAVSLSDLGKTKIFVKTGKARFLEDRGWFRLTLLLSYPCAQSAEGSLPYLTRALT